MRITAGTARGREIVCPPGLDVRPTASKIRQAFFNILRNKVQGAHFLDLFAGSGLMGLEALSRGAAALTSIDESRNMVKIIESNLAKCNFTAQVFQSDVKSILSHLPKNQFDIIFADPPYKSRLSERALNGVAENNLLNAGGILAIEHAREFQLPEESGNLVAYDQRHYGQTTVTFFHHAIAERAIATEQS